MKAMGRFLFLVFILSGLVRAEPAVLKLADGSVVKGEVTPPSPAATEVVVSTDSGVIRVPVAKISPESLKAAGCCQPASTAQYEARIAQLEARIEELEEENAKPLDSDGSFRIADEKLQQEFTDARERRQSGKLTAVEYAAAVRDLRTRELKLFAAVRQHRFKDLTESNYWHRGRLKFPGGIEMELRALHPQ